MKKTLFLMRGLPGSGKSHLAQKLAADSNVAGVREEVFSTDDFFTKDGKYNFILKLIGVAHAWNQDRAKAAMKAGVDRIYIDNTNTQAWEMKPYAEAAIAEGYKVLIIEPDSPWWRNFNSLMSEPSKQAFCEDLARRNKHGVPADIIRKMMDRWEFNVKLEDILNSKRS